MPGGFHTGAAELYRRLAGFKDAPGLPALEEVLAALLKTQHFWFTASSTPSRISCGT
jgi:hypothetical protein